MYIQIFMIFLFQIIFQIVTFPRGLFIKKIKMVIPTPQDFQKIRIRKF